MIYPAGERGRGDSGWGIQQGKPNTMEESDDERMLEGFEEFKQFARDNPERAKEMLKEIRPTFAKALLRDLKEPDPPGRVIEALTTVANWAASDKTQDPAELELIHLYAERLVGIFLAAMRDPDPPSWAIQWFEKIATDAAADATLRNQPATKKPLIEAYLDYLEKADPERFRSLKRELGWDS